MNVQPTPTHADTLTGRPMTSQERILVADDDPALCLLLRETLQEAGYEVLIASDGDQLVRMAQDDPPDLLLIDLNDAADGRLRGDQAAAQRYPHLASADDHPHRPQRLIGGCGRL
jgi:response regulator receiver modulated diguanylate cyclase